MAENFNRQKSARWVDAKVPTYGDDWGYNDDSDDGEELSQSVTQNVPHTQIKRSGTIEEVPEVLSPHISETEKLPSSSPLILSVDKPVTRGRSDSHISKDTSATDEIDDSKSLGQPDSDIKSSPVIERETSASDMRYTDTYVSNFSDDSDNDSIQEEPAELNLGGLRHSGSTTLVSDPSDALNVSLPPLVLSVDRMKLNSYDDDSSSDEKSLGSYNEKGVIDDYNDVEYYDRGDETDIQDVDDDIETQGLSATSDHKGVDTLGPARHRVKTEALDSLINDLQRLEKLSLASLDVSMDDQHSLDSITHHVIQGSNSDSPATDVIKDLSLQSPTTLLEKHHSFVSDLRDRRASIRKAPPSSDSHSDNTTNAPLILSATSPLGTEQTLRDLADHTSKDLDPVVSNGSVSTGSPSFTASVPGTNSDVPEIGRKDSTVSSMQFSMGSWKPNTNVYRDRFVNDNDNESHMNVSMYHEGESPYNKFTAGMRPASGYAESFANSSCISVPDTVEANLQSIDEINSDGDDPSLEIMSVGTAREARSSHLPVVNNATSLSLLRENPYGGGKFQEKMSGNSLDKIGEDQEDGEHAKTESEVSKAKDTQQTSTQPNSVKKYPVYNWKKIMSTSQAIDRILLLKKAREDEEAYDTGLLTWLNEVLHSTDQSSSNIQIGLLATQAYKNAPHSDIRRHISLRSKVSMVRDKMDLGASFGRRFLSKGKKLMKSGSD